MWIAKSGELNSGRKSVAALVHLPQLESFARSPLFSMCELLQQILVNLELCLGHGRRFHLATSLDILHLVLESLFVELVSLLHLLGLLALSALRSSLLCLHLRTLSLNLALVLQEFALLLSNLLCKSILHILSVAATLLLFLLEPSLVAALDLLLLPLGTELILASSLVKTHEEFLGRLKSLLGALETCSLAIHTSLLLSLELLDVLFLESNVLLLFLLLTLKLLSLLFVIVLFVRLQEFGTFFALLLLTTTLILQLFGDFSENLLVFSLALLLNFLFAQL
mmetsp:Transcript_10249/g.38064  ORF Transcript_10249/g.38064 Transcript_10249/m.38064 type:complete len:281 (+) Transcript_10249:197-1039(+)